MIYVVSLNKSVTGECFIQIWLINGANLMSFLRQVKEVVAVKDALLPVQHTQFNSVCVLAFHNNCDSHILDCKDKSEENAIFLFDAQMWFLSFMFWKICYYKQVQLAPIPVRMWYNPGHKYSLQVRFVRQSYTHSIYHC